MPKKNNPRVVIPVPLLKFLELTERICQKHSADGNASALNTLLDLDWDALHPLIAQTRALHEEAEALRMAAEAKMAERNIHLKRLKASTRRTAGFLKSLHVDNPQTLGDWGFEVNASPKKKKPKKADDLDAGNVPLP